MGDISEVRISTRIEPQRQPRQQQQQPRHQQPQREKNSAVAEDQIELTNPETGTAAPLPNHRFQPEEGSLDIAA